MSVIIAARRTAVVPRGGAFQHLSVYQLAAPVIQSLLEQSGIAPRRLIRLLSPIVLQVGVTRPDWLD